MRQEIKAEGPELKFVLGSRYLGVYLRSREELEDWARSQVEAWDRRVCTLAEISKQNPQSAYSGLGI